MFLLERRHICIPLCDVGPRIFSEIAAVSRPAPPPHPSVSPLSPHIGGSTPLPPRSLDVGLDALPAFVIRGKIGLCLSPDLLNHKSGSQWLATARLDPEFRWTRNERDKTSPAPPTLPFTSYKGKGPELHVLGYAVL